MESIDILKETPGPSQNVIQETLLQLQVKNISLRPLIQLLYQMEHGSPPMKIKGMTVESNSEGSLEVKLNLSGYMAKPEKESKGK